MGTAAGARNERSRVASAEVFGASCERPRAAQSCNTRRLHHPQKRLDSCPERRLPIMIRYYARLNAAQVPQEVLRREGVVKLNDFGVQLGFGVSVLRQRQFFQGDSGV